MLDATLEDLQALRLFRAFKEIKDPRERDAVIAYAEWALGEDVEDAEEVLETN